jgi:spore germination protein GerM
MRVILKRMALLAVASCLLFGCRGRTVLHGMHGHHIAKAFTAAATTAATTTAASTAAAAGHQLTVWFVKSGSQGLRMAPVTRRLDGTDSMQQAVRELLDGPTASEEKAGIGTEIPRGTILLDLKRRGNQVELNLSRRFALDGGTTSFETRLDQLRRTVALVGGQADVYLSVEGKRLNVEEGEGIEIHQPINR